MNVAEKIRWIGEMNKAQQKKEEIFKLVGAGSIPNLVHALLYAHANCHIDSTENIDGGGTFIFTYADDSELRIDSDSYCYCENDEEIERLFNE